MTMVIFIYEWLFCPVLGPDVNPRHSDMTSSLGDDFCSRRQRASCDPTRWWVFDCLAASVVSRLWDSGCVFRADS